MNEQIARESMMMLCVIMGMGGIAAVTMLVLPWICDHYERKRVRAIMAEPYRTDRFKAFDDLQEYIKEMDAVEDPVAVVVMSQKTLDMLIKEIGTSDIEKVGGVFGIGITVVVNDIAWISYGCVLKYTQKQWTEINNPKLSFGSFAKEPIFCPMCSGVRTALTGNILTSMPEQVQWKCSECYHVWGIRRES